MSRAAVRLIPVEDPRLVAYWTARGAGAAVDGAALRHHLLERIPRAWIPTDWMPLESFPLAASEKLDYAALPVPEARGVGEAAVRPEATAPPADPLERRLAGWIAELLECPTPDRQADFFALGGHSLAAARLLARVRDALGVDPPLLGFFDAPSVAGLARLVRDASKAATVRARGLDDPTPASPSQLALWSVERLEPGRAHYVSAGGLRLRGPLHVAALETALAAIVERHPILRARFVDTPDGLRLDLDGPRPAASERHDLSALNATQQPLALEGHLRELAAGPFDLASGPLLRTRLLHLETQEHVLLLAQHHAITDGASLDLWVQELDACYAAALRGAQVDRPLPPFDYADWARWQGERLEAERGRVLADFWSRTLAGAPGEPALRADHPLPSERTHAGRSFELALGQPLSEALRAGAARHATSPFTVALAAFAAALARFGGVDEVVLGTAVSGRQIAGTDRLLGLFVNAVPLRLRPRDADHDRAWIAAVGATLRAAQAHGDLPLDRIVEAAKPARVPGRPPLFQVSFDSLGADRPHGHVGPLRVEPFELDLGSAKLDLSVALDEREPELRLRVEYSTEVLRASTVQALLGAFRTVASGLLDGSGRPPRVLPLLDPADLSATLARGRSRAPALEPTPLIEQLMRQARARPSAPALSSPARSLDYRELLETVERAAATLIEDGLAPGDLVELDLPRGVEFIVAALAVWRAGAAWLAGSQSDPRERRERTRARADVRQVVRGIDLKAPAVARDPLPPVRLEPLAYVIATSGTTGEPKLVAVGQRALALHTERAIGLLDLTAQDVVPHRIPPTFDAALLEWWTPLAAGAHVHVVDSRGASDPAAYLEQAAAADATVLCGVPAWVDALARDHTRLGALERLRLVFTGGEPMPPDLPRRLQAATRAAGQSVACFNLYGPSEACIDASWHRCTGGEVARVPLGQPFPGADLFVLEAGERPLGPVPDGAWGELWIGGDGLAEGYRADPAETANRFVLLELEPGRRERVYRTGDRVRRLPGGGLEFGGRLDREAKVGGARVNLEALEAELRRAPGVREAAVWIDTDAEVPLLSAMVAGARASAIRAWLAERAPSAALPSRWVEVERLPRNLHGKFDPAQARPSASATPGPDLPHRAPHPIGPRQLSPGPTGGEHARKAQAILVDVLGRDDIGPQDDFFDLGGSSLGLLRLGVLVRERYGVELDLEHFRRAPTAARLSTLLEGGSEARSVTPSSARAALRAERDALLDAARWPRVQAPRSIRSVLLTGATGFLGGRTAHELAAAGAERIVALVRAADAPTARDRVRRRLEQLGLDPEPTLAVLDARPFDLEDPRGSVAAHVGEVDLVLHCAARVDFFAGYGELAAANVESTRKLLLAALDLGRHVHFVSTLGVVAAPRMLGAGALHEDLPLEQLGGHASGYEQSKWIAERLVQSAATRGLPTTVWRPGRLAPATDTARWPDDLGRAVLVGCLQLGLAPRIQAPVDLTPVDWAAKAIARVALDPSRAGGTLHLVHARRTPFQAPFERLIARGAPLQWAPFDRWRRAALEAIARDPEHPLVAAAPLLGPDADPAHLAPEIHLPHVGRGRLTRALEGADLPCPAIDRELMDRWLDAL
ncbi:MAG: condensation domain-containing protein [Planctomycetota bacterium]